MKARTKGRIERGIYKRGNKLWICYAGPMGECTRESTKGGSINYARELLEQRKAEVKAGVILKNTPKTKRLFMNPMKNIINEMLYVLGIPSGFIRDDLSGKQLIYLRKSLLNVLNHKNKGGQNEKV